MPSGVGASFVVWWSGLVAFDLDLEFVGKGRWCGGGGVSFRFVFLISVLQVLFQNDR